jgi:hypothetical protein
LPGIYDAEYGSSEEDNNRTDLEELSKLAGTEVGTALSYFGYQLKPNKTSSADLKHSEMRRASDAFINAQADQLRDITGFGVNVTDYDGDSFKSKDLAEALVRGNALQSLNYPMNWHDMVAHVPAWLMLSPSLFEKITARTHGLHEAWTQAVKNEDPTEISIAQDILQDHLSDVDSGVDNRFLVKLQQTMRGDINARKDITVNLVAMLHGLSMGSDTDFKACLPEANAEIELQIERVRTIAALALKTI